MTDNPYQTPEASIQNMASHSGEYDETSIFNPSGRMNRSRYLIHRFNLYLGMYLALLLVGLIAIASGGGEPSDAVAMVIGLVAMVGFIFIFVAGILYAIKRFHDMDMSGWLSILTVIPVINIFMFLFMVLKAGTPSHNSYGPTQKPNSTVVKIFVWLYALGIPFLFGILAAIAIPQYQEYVQRASGG